MKDKVQSWIALQLKRGDKHVDVACNLWAPISTPWDDNYGRGHVTLTVIFVLNHAILFQIYNCRSRSCSSVVRAFRAPTMVAFHSCTSACILIEIILTVVPKHNCDDRWKSHTPHHNLTYPNVSIALFSQVLRNAVGSKFHHLKPLGSCQKI